MSIEYFGLFALILLVIKAKSKEENLMNMFLSCCFTSFGKSFISKSISLKNIDRALKQTLPEINTQHD